MAKDINIHVTYGAQTNIIIGTRAEFVAKSSEFFGIPENELEIYEIDKLQRRKISVENLRDVMKVEIRRRSPFGRKTNGHGHNKDKNEPSTSREFNNVEIKQKLLENRTLTGSERKHLLDILDFSFPKSSKRKESDMDAVFQTAKKNVKIQVNPMNLIALKSTETQTDEWIQKVQRTKSSAHDMIAQSKRLAATEKPDPAKVREVMDKTYDDRRSFILMKLPTVSFVKEKYPLLFSLTEVRNESERIFCHGKCEQFLKNIEKYAIHILDMAREDDPLLKTTKQKMESFITKVQKNYALQVGSLLMLSSLMNEERTYLNLLDVTESTKLPYIEVNAAQQSDLFLLDHHIFRILVEKQVLCETSDFREAILCLVCSYFIFDIRYNDSNLKTFVAFERLFLEVNHSDVVQLVQQIIKSIRLKQKRCNRSPHVSTLP